MSIADVQATANNSQAAGRCACTAGGMLTTRMNRHQPITLVLGATGRTGGAVVRELLADPGPERVLVRAAGRRPGALADLARLGIQTAPLDLDGIERAPLAAHRALHGALDGVDRLFLLTGYSVNTLVHSKAIVDAAQLAGMRHIVHMGAGRPPIRWREHATAHRAEYIAATGGVR
jgi:NAD(P)H dehydrogenase (quinone)